MVRTPIDKRSKKANDFIEGADSPSPVQQHQENLSVQERIERRRQGRSYPLYTMRGTESQHELIKYAAKQMGLSQNALLQKYVLEVLEVEFGEAVSIK